MGEVYYTFTRRKKGRSLLTIPTVAYPLSFYLGKSTSIGIRSKGSQRYDIHLLYLLSDKSEAMYYVSDVKRSSCRLAAFKLLELVSTGKKLGPEV